MKTCKKCGGGFSYEQKSGAIPCLQAWGQAGKLDFMLVCDVLLDDFERGAANGGDEIRVCPERRETALELGEFCAKHSAACALKQFHGAVYPELRIDLKEDMDMVRHYLGFNDLKPPLYRNGFDDLDHPCLDRSRQHFPPILRAEDDVIFARVDNVQVVFVLGTCTECGTLHDRDQNAAINTLIAGVGTTLELGGLRRVA